MHLASDVDSSDAAPSVKRHILQRFLKHMLDSCVMGGDKG